MAVSNAIARLSAFAAVGARRARTALGALAVLATLAVGAGPAWAQRAPRADAGAQDEASVMQSGPRVDAIRATLKVIKLPPGFSIDLYAVVPDARHMAVAPAASTAGGTDNAGANDKGSKVFVGTRRSTVWAVTDESGDGVADDVRPFASAAGYRLPNGVCFASDGSLIVAELNRVLRFPGAAAYPAQAAAAPIVVVPQDKLVPPEDAGPGHGSRTCRVGRDGKLYVTIGQPYNVQPREKIAAYEKQGIGGVIRMNAKDGSQREVVARGLRNPVGIEQASDGVFWITDNQTDNMGDDTPPGKLSRLDRIGGHHGYPWVIGTTPITDEVAGYALSRLPRPKNIEMPVVELPAHAADLGLAQYNGTAFPQKYRGAFFIAEHGSWNRTRPIGARVMVAFVNPDGKSGRLEPFAEGWLDEPSGSYRGRPVDVAVLRDGSLLISDDYAGAIYRVTYRAP